MIRLFGTKRTLCLLLVLALLCSMGAGAMAAEEEDAPDLIQNGYQGLMFSYQDSNTYSHAPASFTTGENSLRIYASNRTYSCAGEDADNESGWDGLRRGFTLWVTNENNFPARVRLEYTMEGNGAGFVDGVRVDPADFVNSDKPRSAVISIAQGDSFAIEVESIPQKKAPIDRVYMDVTIVSVADANSASCEAQPEKSYTLEVPGHISYSRITSGGVIRSLPAGPRYSEQKGKVFSGYVDGNGKVVHPGETISDGEALTATWGFTLPEGDDYLYAYDEMNYSLYSASGAAMSRDLDGDGKIWRRMTWQDGLTNILEGNGVKVVTAPSDAGTYAITFDVPNGGENFNSTGTKMDIGTLTISPKDVTITGLSAENKPYDGTVSATVSGSAAVSGRVGSDDVTVTEGTAAFADPYAGTGKKVSFSGYSLDGSKAGNYKLTGQPADATADITAANQTPSITASANLARGGNTLDLSTLVTGAVGKVSYEITGALTGCSVDAAGKFTAGTTAGSCVVTVKVAESTNYKAGTVGTITVTVTEKEPLITLDAALENGTIQVTIDSQMNLDGVKVVAAVYDAKGRMLDLKLRTATLEKGTNSVTITGLGSGETYRVFLLDDFNRPIAQAWSSI